MGKTDNNGQLLTALLTGALVGAAAAILYAPENGKVTRSKIKNKAARASKNLADAAMALSVNVKDSMEESGDSLGYIIGAAIARTVLTVEEIADILKNKLKELKSGAEIIEVENRTLKLPENGHKTKS